MWYDQQSGSDETPQETFDKIDTNKAGEITLQQLQDYVTDKFDST